MQQIRLALALLVLFSAPVAAQEVNTEAATTGVSAWRIAFSELAIARYRAALKLTAAQEKYWPAVAHALRHLARLPQIDEAAVRHVAPQMSPLIATLDDHQKQVAMNLVASAGLSQYASLF